MAEQRHPTLTRFVAVSVLVCACGSSEEKDPIEPSPDTGGADPVFTPDPNLPGPAGWNEPTTKPADDLAEESRLDCGYEAGAMPAATQGASRPNGDEIPIDTFVVAMMENRSFDHYFQLIREAGLDADVAPDDFTNPDTEGNPVRPFRDQVYCFVDTPHGFGSIRRQINGGSMYQFVIEASGMHENPVTHSMEMLDGARAMGYYTREDLPLVYFLAENFAIGDRYFASTPTQTWPNRMYMFAATSWGQANNDFPDAALATTTFFDHLTEREISWKFYHTTVATLGIVINKLQEYADQGHFVPIEQFHTDAAAGSLPQVAFVDPDGVNPQPHTQSDEHPPALMEIGQKWLGDIIHSLTQSEYWERSAMFITYDEHGGLYDHVPPPRACPPDEHFEDPSVRYDQYGVRVPFIAISPFAKKKYVSHRVYDHTSILRFMEARFVLPALTARDANAEAPFDMFDFENPPSVDAIEVPVPVVDQAKLDACNAMWVAPAP